MDIEVEEVKEREEIMDQKKALIMKTNKEMNFIKLYFQLINFEIF